MTEPHPEDRSSRRDRPNPTAEPVVQLSPAQLAADAADLSRSLTRDLDLIDVSDRSALRGLLANLRQLATFGSGEKVILRLCKAFSLEQPVVQVSGPPEAEENVLLSVGSLPSERDTDISLSLEQWMNSPAVVLGGAHREVTNWSDLIRTYGNTRGAHVSPTVPERLVRMSAHQMGGLDMEVWLMRQAGLIAEKCLAQILPKIGRGDYAHNGRKLSFQGVSISYINALMLGPAEAVIYHDFRFDHTDVDIEETLIFDLYMDGYHARSAYRVLDGQIGLKFG